MKKTIGILGGMGPAATADLFQKIVNMTQASCDNEHIRIFIDNNPAIPDRTAAILHGGADPMEELTSALRNLERCGADCILLPCNTAHYFLPRLQMKTTVPILNMLETAANRCGELFPGKTAAVLGTSGMLSTGLYDAALRRADVPFLIPDETEQQTLMHLVYDVVKASLPIETAREDWLGLLDSLRKRGAEVFILGCTELPILAETLGEAGPFLDPTAEIARAAIEFAGYTVKPGF